MNDERQPFDSVAVIGSGTMGSGIAQVVAEANIPVIMIDLDPIAIERGTRRIERNWDRSLDKGTSSRLAIDQARANLSVSESLEDTRGSALIIEAAIEQLETKQSIFRQLSQIARTDAVLASNTSSISITQLGAVAIDATRVVGMHFFNPVPRMLLVEVVRGERTSEETVERVRTFAEVLGKTPISVNDMPGFVSNRILMPMINEAVFCLSEGVATREAIDQIMVLGMAHPIGPLSLADLIGLDVCLQILETLQRDLGEDKYRPAPLMRKLVASGKLGRKSGEGFFRYEPS